MSGQILLLDAYNLIYRSFTVVPRSIVGRDGSPIHGIYGFLGTIIKTMRELDARRLIAAFDAPGQPTFRGTLFSGYQAQRGPLGGDYAEDFARQVGIAFEVLPRLGIPSLICPGFEADDIIGTLATECASSGRPSVIVSTDRDLLQLVGPHVEVLAPLTPPIHARSAEDVRARLGVPPERVADYKALAGDPSDNVPGISGIGGKTAAKLVNRYGSLEEIFDDLTGLPGRVATRLAGQRETALLFREVVTIRRDLALSLGLNALPETQIQVTSRPRELLDAFGLG
jgi:DNA polymerase-1